MPDYSKTVIYKLCCKNLDVKEIYVGSTCNFTKRKGEHKKDSFFEYRKNYNSKVYKFIRDNGRFENWDMILIEEYPCENKMQKTQRERYWCEELKSELNSNVPGRSIKESREAYRSQHRNQLCQRSKEYYESNKEKVKEYQKEYNMKNSEKVKQSRHEYYERNKHNLDKEKKEEMNQKKREYREANKDKINQRQREYRAKKKNDLLKDKE